VLINVTGSVDIGLEEVETAANLVQEAAHPDCNIIFGATFDENLEDEMRVTVIATGFEEPESSISSQPFTAASARVEAQPVAAAPAPAAAPAAPVAPPVPEVVEEKSSSSISDEDWDILNAIFSKRKK